MKFATSGLKTARTNMLVLLYVMYALIYMDRVNVGTAADAFRKDLGFSHFEVGLVFSLFAYPYLLFQIAGGWFADRFGSSRRRRRPSPAASAEPMFIRALAVPANCGAISIGTAHIAPIAILSPTVFGLVIDRTGNWSLPFVGSMVLLGMGAVGAFFMRPERRFA